MTHMHRYDRKFQIASELYDAYDARPEWGFSMYRICVWVDMKPSKHLMGILMEMVFDGTLETRVELHRPATKKSKAIYRTLFRVADKRNLNVNVKKAPKNCDQYESLSFRSEPIIRVGGREV